MLPVPAVEFLLRTVRPVVRRFQRAFLPPVGIDTLLRELGSAGIAPGDVLMVHSSLARIGNVSAGPKTVIDSLMGAITPDGTLIMPCHYPPDAVMGTADAKPVFDMVTIIPNTGSIPRTFCALPDVLWSSHPFASSCAWGKYARYITDGHDLDPRICHKDSPLGRLWTLGGKLMGIGVSIGPVGFYHVLEDTWPGFPFEVYLPMRTVTYRDRSGALVRRDLCRYDPVIARTRIEKQEGEGLCEALTEHLHRRGILRRFTFGRAQSWVMEVRPLYDELKHLAQRGVTIYSLESELRAVMRDTQY